jgi:hypothetical protein
MAGGGSLDERESIAWGTRKMQSVIRQYYINMKRIGLYGSLAGILCTKLIEGRIMKG